MSFKVGYWYKWTNEKTPNYLYNVNNKRCLHRNKWYKCIKKLDEPDAIAWFLLKMKNNFFWCYDSKYFEESKYNPIKKKLRRILDEN